MAMRGPPPEADDESEDLLEIQLLLQEDHMKVKKLKGTIAMVMAVVMTASSLTTYFPSYAAESESETETVTEVSESETAATEGETQESGTTETTSETAAAESDSQESVESSGNDNSTVDSETEKKTETSNDTEAEEEEETETPTYTVTLPYYEDADYTYDEEKLKEQAEDKSLVLEYEAGETVEISIEPLEDILIDELHVFYSENEEISFEWAEEDKKLTFSMPEQDVWLDVTLISAAESETESEQETESVTTEEAWGWVEYDTTEGGSISASFEYYGEVFDAGTYTYDMVEYGPWEAQYETVGTITVTATADDGYVLKTITLTDEEGNEIASYDTDTISFSADGTRKIIVTAVFVEADADAETVSESETEDSTEAGTESESESELDTETETEMESETEAESESESEPEIEMEAADYIEIEEDDSWQVDDYPEAGSTIYYRTKYVWEYDTTFDPASYLVYEEDSNVIQTYVDGTVGFEAGESYSVTYSFYLESEVGYSWTGIVTFEIVSDRDEATAKSDICDKIILGEITQGEEWSGVVPDLAYSTLEGPSYTAYLDDDSFDLYLLNLGYDPDLFNMTVYDDGGFDIGTVGEYTVTFEVSYYMMPNYPWYVESTISVVEPYVETAVTTVHAATRNLVIDIINADGTTGQASYGVDYESSGGISTMTVSSYTGSEIELDFALLKGGEETDVENWITITEESGTSVTAAVNVDSGAGYTIEVSDLAYDITDGGNEKSSGGWVVDAELEESLASGDISSEEAIAVIEEDTSEEETSTASEEGISMVSEDEISTASDEGISTVASSSTTYTKSSWSSSLGSVTLTSTCHNYTSSGSKLAYNGGYFTLSSKVKTEINEWLEDKGVTLTSSLPSTISVSCSDGNHSRWGWYAGTSGSWTLTAKLVVKESGSGTLTLTLTGTNGSSYQTFSGSARRTTETDSYYLKITKKITDTTLSWTPRINLQTSFTIYTDADCTEEYTTVQLESDGTSASALIEVDEGTYYAKETGLADGCTNNYDSVYGPVTAGTESDPGVFHDEYSTKYIYNWPYVFFGNLAVKTDQDGNPLAGAVFKVVYSPEAYGEDGYEELKTWYLYSDEDGNVKYSRDNFLESWNGNESDDMIVYGDGTYSAGDCFLPIGYIYLTEVEAPEGYVIEDGETFELELVPAGTGTTLDRHLKISGGVPTIVNTSYGYLELSKTSDNTAISADNSAYSLAGATYAIYTDAACTIPAMDYSTTDYGGSRDDAVAAVFTTDADGNSVNANVTDSGGNSISTVKLAVGDADGTTYYIKETAAPAGYELDTTVHEVVVKTDDTADEPCEYDLADTPMVYYTDLILQKTTESNTSVSLEGAVFKLEFYAGATDETGTATKTWYLESDADGSVLLRDSYLAAGYTSSGFYTDASGTICLPFGFLKITEEKEPAGYVRSDDVVTYTLTSTGWTISRNGTAEATGTVSTAASATISNETVQKAGYIDNEPVYGGVSLDKKDKETSDGSAQGDGSLAGFTFDIISENDFSVVLSTDKSVSHSKGDVVMTLTTDENGHAESGTVIQAGTYTVVESGQNEAYTSDGTNTSYTITISEEGQVISYEVTNEVKKGGISLQKADAETGESSAQGEASLESATFAIINASEYAVLNAERNEIPTAKAVISDTPTAAELRELAADGSYTVQTITTDTNGFATTDADGDGTDDSLPYGTYYVVEIESSYGYWIDENFVGKAVVHSDGTVTALGATDGESSFTDIYDTNDATVDQTPRRGDLTFQKVDIDGNYKSFIPFLISAIVVDDAGSETVVESHVIVSDANGTVNTARTHSANTNGFDQYVENGVVTAEGEALLEEASGWGVWFGSVDALNDEYGAMYTCYYRITELQCEDNSSKSENLLESDLIYIDNTTGDEAEVLSASTTNNAELHTYHPLVDTEIVLTSTALDAESGTQTVSVKSENEVTDQVSYTHVSADHTYRMETQFVDITDGSKVLTIVGTDDAEATVSDDGLWVTKEFQPEQKSGTNNTYGDITMSATLDTTGLNGHTIVAVDYLYQYVNGYWILVAKHEDYTDTDQMLYVPDLHTSAVDGQTGSRTGTKAKEASILDTVQYSNLAKGEMYVITMQVINAVTGEVVEDGKTVTSKRIYSRSDTPVNGTVEMPEFTLDTSAFYGDAALVVVESLYRADEDGNPIGEAVLTHDSLVDEDQTIRYPDVHTSASDSLTGDDVGTSSETATVYDEVTVTNVIFDDNDLDGQYTYTVKGTLVYQQDCTDADGVAHKAGETVETLDGTYDTVTITSDASGNATFTYEDGTAAKGSITITAYGQNVAKTAGGDAADNSYVTDSTAAVASITVELIYKVDSSKLEGNTVVVFEDLFHNNVKVASHADLTDEAQSVHYPEVKTSAADNSTADDVGAVTENATIIDTVTLTNLVPGRSYTVSGKLVDQKTGEDIIINGAAVTQTAEITVGSDGTITAANGEETTVTEFDEEHSFVSGMVALTFTFDASGLAGESVVVFEDLIHNGITVASHADITDEDQTIHFPMIETTAVDGYTGDAVGTVSEDAVIVDTVIYTNLVPGREYTVSGVL
ncbi:MAG: VaFE repeat-containing surface-anchored protein, partial [Clostridiales bacterium]|nr:VaFE repeat-containing surface-anchored protein [Clostridiales bacterium]